MTALLNALKKLQHFPVDKSTGCVEPCQILTSMTSNVVQSQLPIAGEIGISSPQENKVIPDSIQLVAINQDAATILSDAKSILTIPVVNESLADIGISVPSTAPDDLDLAGFFDSKSDLAATELKNEEFIVHSTVDSHSQATAFDKIPLVGVPQIEVRPDEIPVIEPPLYVNRLDEIDTALPNGKSSEFEVGAIQDEIEMPMDRGATSIFTDRELRKAILNNDSESSSELRIGGSVYTVEMHLAEKRRNAVKLQFSALEVSSGFLHERACGESCGADTAVADALDERQADVMAPESLPLTKL